jgi:hypothetical protein
MSIPVPLYGAQLLISIDRTITRERLTRYLRASAQDLPRALQLYEYNVALSEVLYGLLHGLEVAIRNVEHHTLTASYATPTWYDKAPLSRYWKDQVQKAKRKAGSNPAAGNVIPELTFKFWVDLLSKRNKNALWIGRQLKTAFPNTALPQEKIHQRLKAIHLLRNRISHHEPVLTAAKSLYTGDGAIALPELLECVEWVCIDTAQWMKTRFRYAEAERILREVAAMKISL